MIPFNVVAPLASADGYGASAEDLIRSAVHDHGAEIGLISHDWRDDRFCDQQLLDLEVDRSEVDGRDVLLVYFLPYGFAQFRSRVTIGQTMFETTRIPDTWARLCDAYAQAGVIVPSEFCRAVFARQVGVPVKAVPLGVNTDTYGYVERVRAEDHRPFVFLMAGMLHYRKGVEFAIRALREEFGPTEPVSLILKTRRHFLDMGDEWDPRVTVVADDLSRADMRALYGSADCFVACSRGEGAGLTPREAMATGLPAIITDWGGLHDIAHPDYTYPLAIDGEEPAPLECSSYGAGVTRGEPIGDFARPSVTHLRELMRHVYENRGEARDRGRRAADWIRRDWNAAVCSRRWLDAIEELATA